MDYNRLRIQKASKEYLCCKCQQKIEKGTEYVDDATKYTDADGKVTWIHDRYHINCNPKSDGDILDRIYKLLRKEGPFLRTEPYGDKFIIQGIIFNHNGTPFVVCRDWETEEVSYKTVEEIKTFIDEKGETL